MISSKASSISSNSKSRYKKSKTIYIFTWQSNSNPDDKNQQEEWTEYPENIQKFLNEKYEEYLKGNLNRTELIQPLQEYTIDFGFNVQLRTQDPNKIRIINIEKRDFAKELSIEIKEFPKETEIEDQNSQEEILIEIKEETEEITIENKVSSENISFEEKLPSKEIESKFMILFFELKIELVFYS